MDQWLVPLLVAFTSVGGYWAGSRRAGLSARALPAAVARALEAVGAAVFFFAGNAALSVLAVLGIRSVSDSFLSLHELSMWILLVLSLLQALVFQAWRQSGPAS
jgi:hypothetical protein